MTTIFPFDAINTFKANLSRHFENGRIKSQEDVEDIIDEILDLCLLAYANGVWYIRKKFDVDIEVEPSVEELETVVYKQIDGKTWEDRVRDWYEKDGTEEDILRIAETETHRVGNESAEGAAAKAGAKEKTWMTMMDDRVRENHEWLQSVTVPIGARFYSPDGDSARFPGDFNLAENNCGCRCELDYR